MAPVVQKLDNAIHWIAQLVSLTLNRWIVIYPLDSAIQGWTTGAGPFTSSIF